MVIIRTLCLSMAVAFVLTSGRCYCETYDVDMVPAYGSKTPYEASFTQMEKDLLNNPDSFVPNTCTPIHISAAIRHAIRFPDEDDIHMFEKSVDKIRWKIRHLIYADLNNTAIVLPDYEPDQLAAEGREEMRHMAKRIAKRYDRLLKDAQHNEKIFYCSSRRRTQDSGISFQGGLTETFIGNQSQQITERNDLLRFYDQCPHHDMLFENDTALLEHHKYLKGPELATLAQNVITKLMVKNNTSLQPGNEAFIWLNRFKRCCLNYISKVCP